MKVFDIVGQKDPVRGWFALNAIVPSHDIIYRLRAELPRHFETVIQPMSVGTTSPMSVKTLEVASADNKSCAALSCGDDTFLLSHDGPTQMTCGDIRFDGTALLLSRDPSGRPVRLHMVGGRRMSLAGKDVFSTDAPTPTRTLELP